MKTLLIPTFNEFRNYEFVEYKKVKVKNKMDTKDYNKIASLLPGVPCGYCHSIYNIDTLKKVEIRGFYDIRQKNVNKLKNYYIHLNQIN